MKLDIRTSKLTTTTVVVMLWMTCMNMSPLMAQQYGNSAGVRLGDNGITFKNFVVEEQAYELMLTNRKNGVQFTFLYLNHLAMDLSFSEHIFFCYGSGAHIGYEEHADIHHKNPAFFEYESQNYVNMGVDGMAGLEYRMLGIPMTLSLDLVPYINYVGFRKLDVDFWNVSVGLKYIF